MRLIDADAAIEAINKREKLMVGDKRVGIDHIRTFITNRPTIDYAPVKRGKWKLQAEAFYKDNFFEDVELCVYILADCNVCASPHPDGHEVYSKTLCHEDSGLLFNIENEKQQALEEFRSKGRKLAKYCPNCGAKMGD